MSEPDEVGELADPADEFCRLACLVYGPVDGPDRWAAARAVLADRPDLPRRSIWAAAAASDPEAVAAHLAVDPAFARTGGGPFGWEPLLYLTYSRLDPGVTEERVLGTARLLLDAGADPGASYRWHGLEPPFTALTGAFGEGEQGPGRQPRHPHSLALARLLLAAGADPNDGQALYNRMFFDDDDHLRLLLEHGLGRGEDGARLLAEQVGWAVLYGFAERVRLLVEHGADVRRPLRDGRTPVRVAALNGHSEILRLLVDAGAPPAAVTAVEALVGAILAGDRALASRFLAADPGLLEAARAARPALVAEAVEAHQPVDLAVELGFDVDALDGRATALHSAAWAGDLELVRRLVELGADTGVRDLSFDSTPLGWARHALRHDVADYLAPLTPSESG